MAFVAELPFLNHHSPASIKCNVQRGRSSLLTLAALFLLGFASSASALVDAFINFQPSTSAVPAGYVQDTGLGYVAF